MEDGAEEAEAAESPAVDEEAPGGLQSAAADSEAEAADRSEAAVVRVSEPALNPPGASHLAGFLPRPPLSCSLSLSPRQPSCPGEDDLNQTNFIST